MEAATPSMSKHHHPLPLCTFLPSPVPLALPSSEYIVPPLLVCQAPRSRHGSEFFRTTWPQKAQIIFWFPSRLFFTWGSHLLPGTL